MISSTEGTSRSSDCSPQGVMMDYITAVVAIAQILVSQVSSGTNSIMEVDFQISVMVGMKSDNNSNNNNNNSKQITLYTLPAAYLLILRQQQQQ